MLIFDPSLTIVQHLLCSLNFSPLLREDLLLLRYRCLSFHLPSSSPARIDPLGRDCF